MREGAVLPGATKVEVANVICVVFILAILHGPVGTHIHISVVIFRVCTLRSISKGPMLTGPSWAFDSVRQGALWPRLLKRRVYCRRDKTGHELCHHPRLFFKEGHQMHLIVRIHVHQVARGTCHMVVPHSHAAAPTEHPSITVLVKAPAPVPAA
jgi:hypothetical protein